MENTSHKLITILDTQFLHEIQIAQSKLNLEGINSYIVDEHITSTIGTAFIEGYKLQVNSLDMVKAKYIIDSLVE